MVDMMKSWIDDYVIGIIDFCNTDNIYDIYECLEIRLVKLDKQNVLLQGNASIYHRSYLGKEVVFIRDDLNTPYEKYILAHELCHAVLHTYLTTSIANNPLINKDKLESQADYFASKLIGLELDNIDFEGFTLEQIACTLELPVSCLKNINLTT
jgi:Zn-dependent peptidase ImmA (M78 family)